MHRRFRLLFVALATAPVLPLAACGGDSEPGGGGSASSGEDVYRANCQTCHGPDGEGGTGPQLGGGAMVEAYPDIEDQIAVIRDGVGGMPAWEGDLSPEEIEAVATFEREELGNT